jgi:DNA-binding NarL/FixJ family response regulator
LAQLAGRDPTTDVAVLRLSENLPEPARVTVSDAARVGQMVLALGRGDDGVIANLGMVSVAGGPWQSMRGGNIDSLIRLDIRLSHRAEGGLVVDSEGRLLGMAVLGPRQTTLVIPMRTVERLGAQLLADGRIRRGYLGVGLHGIRLDEALAASLSLPDRRAIMVVSVDPNGPARKAGVLVGDVIVGFDGEAVSGVRSLLARLTPESVGKAAELRMLRAGQIATARLAIGVSPAPSPRAEATRRRRFGDSRRAFDGGCRARRTGAHDDHRVARHRSRRGGARTHAPSQDHLWRGRVCANVPVLVLTDASGVVEALQAGASAVLSECVDGDTLSTAVRAAAQGLLTLSAEFRDYLVDASGSGSALESAAEDAAPAVELTARELQVLRLLAEGSSNKSIAQQLGITTHTAKFHVASIGAKLGAAGRTDAVAKAMRLGLVMI